MDKNRCSISIIIPVYRGLQYLPKLVACIEACVEYIPGISLELILSNDSPDEPLPNKIISSLISIRVLNTDQNRGIHDARVRGLQNSTGDYILFLDQDDRIVPEYFHSQLYAICSADAVVCNALSGGRLRYNTDRPLYKAADRKCMINEGCMILSPGQVLIRRTAIPRVWVENLMHHNGADDWLLWLCMHSAEKKFAINQDVLFIRDVHYHNASFDSLKMAASEREAVEIIETRKQLKEEERKVLKELLPEIQERRIKETEKFKRMFFLQNDWFSVMNKGETIAGYLSKRQVKKLAIYGYGYLGKTLLENLKKSNIVVSYVIDKNADYLEAGVKCCTLENAFEKVDAVIVAFMSDCRKMVDVEIGQKLDAKIFWLEDIVSDMAGCHLGEKM